MSFKLAADVQGGPTIKSVEVFWGGNSIGTFTFDQTGHTETSMGWVGSAVAGLSATGTTTRLLFKDLTASGFGAALDDVRVIPSSVAPVAPVITWGAPAPITFGTPLSVTQLSATTTVPGTFVYTPSLGTLLQAGAAQTLSVTFTPDDPIHYLPASASVSIDVVQATQAALSVTGAPSSAPNGFSFAVSTSGGSGGGAVTFAVTGPCSIAGSQVTMTGTTGTCSIIATKAADPNFLEVMSAPAMVSATSATLIQWISDASGFWDEAANWSGNHVPANGDQVVIDRPAGNFTITIRTPTANIQSLYATEALSVSNTLTVAETGSLLGGLTVSGTLAGTGTIVVGGPAAWIGGTVSLQGGLDIAAGQTLTMTGDLVVTDSALRNYGTVAWSSGRLGFMSTAHVTNQAGGVWDVRGDLRLENFGSTGTKTFTNLGTLKKTVGAGALTVNGFVYLTNPGRIELETGAIAFEGPSNNSGHLALAGGTTFQLGNVTLEGTTTFSGTGTLNFSGTTTIPSALTIPLTTIMSSAIINGAGSLTMAAPTTASNTVVALVGGLEIETGQTLTVQADFIFPDSSLRNRGTVVWTGGRFGFQSSTAMVNQAGGVFDVRGDLRLENFGSTGTKTFTNLGTLKKTVGAGALTVNGFVYLTNPGRIELETGAIAFEGPSNNSGHLALAGGTTFQLGNVTLEGTTTFSGTGTLNFSGTTTIPSALTIPLTTIMSSAIINGAGSLTMAAPTTASNTVVALVGGLEIETGQTLTVQADFIFPDSSLRNRGTVVWTGGRFGFQSSTAMVNQAGGVFDVRGDLRLENFGSTGTKTFTNLGTLKKTVGAGALTVNGFVYLTNPGRIELETGAIAFEGPSNNSGHLALAGGTTFQLGNVTLEGTTTFSGTGTLNFSGTDDDSVGADDSADVDDEQRDSQRRGDADTRSADDGGQHRGCARGWSGDRSWPHRDGGLGLRLPGQLVPEPRHGGVDGWPLRLPELDRDGEPGGRRLGGPSRPDARELRLHGDQDIHQRRHAPQSGQPWLADGELGDQLRQHGHDRAEDWRKSRIRALRPDQCGTCDACRDARPHGHQRLHTGRQRCVHGRDVLDPVRRVRHDRRKRLQLRADLQRQHARARGDRSHQDHAGHHVADAGSDQVRHRAGRGTTECHGRCRRHVCLCTCREHGAGRRRASAHGQRFTPTTGTDRVRQAISRLGHHDRRGEWRHWTRW